MYFFKFLIFFAFTYTVYGRNSVKALTDAMGQEIIEIGAPIKELPPGLEEEPSGEPDTDSSEEARITATLPPGTKKDAKKATKSSKGGKPEAANQLNQEDDESRIEKELSELYKDTDYKSDVKESLDEGDVALVKEKTNVLRQKAKTNFKFSPDSTDKASIERFRTSVDDIVCDRGGSQRLTEVEINVPTNNSRQLSLDCIIFGLAVLSNLM